MPSRASTSRTVADRALEVGDDQLDGTAARTGC